MDAEAALDLLLRDRWLRRAFRDGRLSLDLDAAARAALALIAPAELDQLASLICREVFGRGFAGAGTLLDAFSRTLAACADLDELAAAFIESTAYAAYRDVGVGVSLEEAFYWFALSIELADPDTLEDEFLAATMRALAACPAPRYRLPAEVRRQGDAIVARGRCHVYVLAGGALARFDVRAMDSCTTSLPA